MTKSLASALLLLVACLLAVGCQEDLPKATEITHMRILGAKLQVVGDETRSTPKPGESVKATFATVFASQTRTNEGVQAMMIGCTAPQQFTGGLPICQEFLDAAGGEVGGDIRSAIDISEDVGPRTGASESGKLTCEDLPMPKIRVGRLSIQCLRGDPIAEFDVAPNFEAERMLFLGVVCEHGTAFIDPSDPLIFGCDDNDGETTRVNGLIPIQHDPEDENRNPSVGEALKLLFSTYTAPWLAPEGELPPMLDCEGDEQIDQEDPLTMPYADPGRHVIRIQYDGEEREQVDGVPEDLEFTVYTTAGEMERRFTLFSGEDTSDQERLRGSVDWQPPDYEDLPRSGELVRFFVTLRDQRGGFDVTTRVACAH